MKRKTRPIHQALQSTTWAQMIRSGQEAGPGLFTRTFPLPGASYLTIENMPPHTAIVGSTGSGKTIIQKHLMSSVLPAPIEKGGLAFRSVVYDPKRELFPFLCKLGIPQSQIIVTQPFDRRSACWDLAADFQEPAQIEELAEMIIPEAKHQSENSFFSDTCRIILAEVIGTLHEIRPRQWDLRDVCNICLSLDYLKSILTKTPVGQYSWETYLKPIESEYGDRTAQSILASLATHIKPFQSLAALWHNAEKSFSLERWHKGSGLLLIGADPRRERTLQRLNQLLIRRICQYLLGRDEENSEDLTWFFMDELREAGKLNGIRQLLTEGRSKGARVVVGFQDIEGLYSLYDEHEAEEMIGLCANRVALHLDNPKTRKWASEFFGEAEEYLPGRNKSDTHGREKTTNDGITFGLGLRANVLPIQFHNLPLGNLVDGVKGWYAIPGKRISFI